MNATFAGMYRLQLIALTLMLAAASAQGQSAWAYADVYYDAATDKVIANTTTLVDYSTEYYYSPKVQVSLSGSDGTYAWWYCPVGGAGACTNGNYAFGDVSVSATPGVTYTVQGYHSVAVYYHYYEADPGCAWGCDQWYDALGYSTGQCNSACEADPNCFCVEVWGAPYNHSYLPPWVVHLTYAAEQILGDTSKQATTQQALLSCTSSVVTRGSNVNCTVTGPGSTRVTEWSFTGGGGNVSGPPGVTWGGTMVQSGTISAKAAGLPTQPASFNITVNPRSGWGTAPVGPTDKTNTGYSIAGCIFVSPPPNTSATLGCSTYTMSYETSTDLRRTVPNGPNEGFMYYHSNYTYNQMVPWMMHPEVKNNTEFASKQHGGCGYLTITQLRDTITWHESSSIPPSHYALHKDALQTYNYGIYVEARVAAPQVDKQQFHSATLQQFEQMAQSILNWMGQENLLRDVNHNQATGAWQGYVNYPIPYDSLCNQ